MKNASIGPILGEATGSPVVAWPLAEWEGLQGPGDTAGGALAQRAALPFSIWASDFTVSTEEGGGWSCHTGRTESAAMISHSGEVTTWACVAHEGNDVQLKE